MRSRKTHHRRGFTLVELMVVIGILALLIAISAFALRGFSTTAKEKATEATIQRMSGLLEDRMQAFNRHYTKPPSSRVQAMMTKYPGTSQQAGEALARKEFFRDFFPQNFAEATLLIRQSVNPNYQYNSAQPNPDVPTVSTVRPEIESAQILYFILTQSSVLGYSPETSEFGTGVKIPEATSASDPNPKWPYFVDAWDRPIRFYRWPTRLIKPNGTDTRRDVASLLIQNLPASDNDLHIDPDDPTGGASTGVGSEGYHTPDTFHTPLIVSAGPDSEFGMFDQNDTGNFGHLARPRLVSGDPDPALFDNITNRNRRAGGQ